MPVKRRSLRAWPQADWLPPGKWFPLQLWVRENLLMRAQLAIAVAALALSAAGCN